jgi:hypothetical protein
VALQGTLETFSLPDVLQLLASTKKSGCLLISGDRGTGSVWVVEGAIVKSEATGAPHASGAVDVVFELLRYQEGEFVFEDGGEVGEPDAPTEVAALLEEAGAQLEEWRAIEAVVPSGASWVTFTPELPGDEVTIPADRWKALVAVGGGSSVAGLGDTLDLAELPVARLVKELVEQGLVQIGEAPLDELVAAEATAEAEILAEALEDEITSEAAVEEEITGEAVVETESPSLSAVPEAAEEYEPFDPNALVIDPDSPLMPTPSPAFSVVDDEPVAAAPEDVAPEVVAPEPGEAAEFARQLANLSPKAARAVAAAAKATTPEEREAALAEVEASDDQINRDLLLKFLGTVN